MEQKTNANWNEKTLKFLKHHKYFTPYCQSILNKGKEENINILKAKLNEG